MSKSGVLNVGSTAACLGLKGTDIRNLLGCRSFVYDKVDMLIVEFN